MNASSPKFGWALYAVSLAIETAAGCLRGLLVALVLYVPTQLFGDAAITANTLAAFAVGLEPVALSVAAAAGVPGGALERFRLGARHPSHRERHAVDHAFRTLSRNLRAPRRWFVIDSPDVNAMVIGDVLYVHRALIADPALSAVLAHELGHLNSLDGRLTLALRRFTLTHRRPPGILAGGLSLRLLGQLWLAWWRQREHAADAFAAHLGHGEPLAALLERTQLLDTAVPYMRDRAHPYSEQHIERLRAFAREDQPA